jgi:hypothetical protein
VTPPTDETAKLAEQLALLTKQLEVLQKQAELDRAKQTQDAATAKALLDALKAQSDAQAALDQARQTQEADTAKAVLDALKAQVESQAALDQKQAQLPFAQLQGIKEGTSGLTLPTGKEGTVTVAAGTAGTALLRSKRPMLGLLNEIADALAVICDPDGAVVATEAQLQQAYKAKFAVKAIEDQKKRLEDAVKAANPGRPAGPFEALAIAPVIAGAYTAGLALNTINSFAKLLRKDRTLDVFGYDVEAVQMLGYLLESKGKGFVANPALLGEAAIAEADALMAALRDLQQQVQAAGDTLDKIKDLSGLPADDPRRNGLTMPDEGKISTLKVEKEGASALLDSLLPAKKPDDFWTQVVGQIIARNIQDRNRLLIEAKAQSVQITESRWYGSSKLLVIGEVQVAYRLLDKDGKVLKSGVMLRGSEAKGARLDELKKLAWPAS